MREVPVSELQIKHFFGAGVYAKETFIPVGHLLVQHKHLYDHLSILATGKVVMNGITYTGPCVLTIKAGVNHAVWGVENSVWYCIHATSETDLTKIDDVLSIPSSREDFELAVEKALR